MRMAFGLVGLLVTLGVIIWIFHVYTAPSLKVAGQTRQKVNAWAESNTAEGMEEARASIVLKEVRSGGKFSGFLVQSVVSGGPMARDFGLAPGDVIVAIGPIPLEDPELSDALLFGEAKLYNRPLTVIRGGTKIELVSNNKLNP